MQKLLSIIIPTYNMEALLDQCLTSLILDTKELREKLDVIVVIDGATDCSSEIAHKYADNYPEMFSVIDKENGNYGSCINAALPYVKGKYVRILDADDSCNLKELPGYLDMLRNLNVELVLTDFETINPQGVILAVNRLPVCKRQIMSFQKIPVDYFIMMHSVAYRSDVFSHINYCQTEGVSYTDAEWVFHPMSEVHNVFYYDKVLYRYLLGREGQTVEPSIVVKKLSDVEKGIWNQLKIYKQLSPENAAYKYLTCGLYRRIKRLYVDGLDKLATIDLVSFDKRLKFEYPEVYYGASKITIPVGLFNLQMPIIKMWRKVKNKKGLYLFPLYDLHIIVNKLKK